MSRKNKTLNTKRGAASLYIVVFVTLVLGVVTLSFVRVMLSNSKRATSTDLAQSALDSAQAGVEDARIALLKYHECLSNKSASGCATIISTTRQGIKNKSCDVVQNILGRSQESGDKSTVIQETQNSSDDGNSSSMLQAYTCVKITEELNDYRTTLDLDNSSRIVPIRVDDGDIDKIAKIKVQWFSAVNSKGTNTYGDINGQIGKTATTVPVISVQLFQVDTAGFSLGELSVGSTEASGGTDHFTVFLNPISPSEATTENSISELSATQLKEASYKNSETQTYFNTKCSELSESVEFSCSMLMNIPKPFKGGSRGEGSTFLFISMPYGGSATDVSVQLYDADDNIIKFDGVQALVDSTGRANDLYRRIETRLELVDIYFPYPEYEIEQSGTAELNKKTRVAENCWYTVSKPNGKAQIVECPAVVYE